MNKGPILLAASILGNIVFVFLLTTMYLEKQDCIKYQNKIRSLQADLSRSNKLVKEKSDSITACLKAVIGEESDFDPMYHSVEEASRIEMIVYTEDTESGEPRRFTMQGCIEKKDGEKK